jgi:hypothetical protein
MFVCLLATPTFAANYTVTTAADTGAGGLRAAIASANASVDADTITFAIPAGNAGCTAGGVCTITLTSGELVVNSTSTAGTLTITNLTGANNLLVSGNNASRVFFVNEGANLKLSGITITKGNGTGTTDFFHNGEGGGIFNLDGAATTLTNSIVSGNTASKGGGIFNDNGGMTLTNSTVSDNSQTGGGSVGFNGGIFNFEGGMTLTGSTVSGNSAGFNGGGIISICDRGCDATLNLTSVTVTLNKSTSTTFSAGLTGGVANLSVTNFSTSTANLKNTIVAGNTAANNPGSPDFNGDVTAGSSFNLIGVDAKLAPLANNGEATQTHALLFGSPALDKGNSFGLTTD